MRKDDLGDRLHRQEALNLATQFENMLRNNQSCFLGHDGYEHLIEYYEDCFEFLKAMTVTDYALEQHPFSATFLIKKASLLYESKKCTEALDLLERASVLAPSELEVFLLQAEIFTHLEEYAEARDLLEQALHYADREEKADLYLALADVYESWDNDVDAYEYIQQALRLRPSHNGALSRIDYYVNLNNDFETSILLHKWIIDQDPYCYLAWYNLGNAYFGLELYEKAIDAYEYVIAINDQYDLAYRDCGEAYFELKQYNKAKEQYKEALDVGEPDDELFYNIGICCSYLKQYKEAISFLIHATRINPEYHEAHFQAGECYYALLQLKDALVHYSKALQLDGENNEYITKLAKLYSDLNNHEMTVALYHDAVDIHPENKSNWIKLFETYFNLQLFEHATDVVNTAINQIDRTSDLLYLLAASQMSSGKKYEAVYSLSEALTINYQEHHLFFDLMPHLCGNPTFFALVEQYRTIEA